MDPLSLLKEEQILPNNESIFENFKHGKFIGVLESTETSQVLAGNLAYSPSDNAQVHTERHDAQWSSSSIANVLSQWPDQADLNRQRILVIGLSALYTFLQANVTGPPPDLKVIKKNLVSREPLKKRSHDSPEVVERQRNGLDDLKVDGIAPYHLTPHVELFSLASSILNHPSISELGLPTVWARLRTNFWHQKLLPEAAPSLREKVYQDLASLSGQSLHSSGYGQEARTWYLLERAAINLFYGHDREARGDIDDATKNQNFEFVLTGRLGKRTKFQQNDLSQLVVLAENARTKADPDQKNSNGGSKGPEPNGDTPDAVDQPRNLHLNDDTLLEAISFSIEKVKEPSTREEQILASLSALDPANQPLLDPLNSIILLSLATAITNTSPEHGLTREETLPYATRVLEGGSSNWQLYTQALLVRSRIEGHRSRTVERSVLQLQALVDQVVAATTSSEDLDTASDTNGGSAPTFLPRAKETESASAAQRLRYVHQLSPPFRWALEAELASRWVSIGGLRTAVEIYERLEMWAEAALCWAASGKESNAREILRRQLHLPKPRSDGSTRSHEVSEAAATSSLGLPSDAPRLLCILGDVESAPAYYEQAWKVSECRYARAQRSLGKHYMSKGHMKEADEAYAASLRIDPQNAGAWYSLGCVRLARQDWEEAVEAFTRTIKIEPEDAEAWSNLGAALVRTSAQVSSIDSPGVLGSDNKGGQSFEPQKRAKEALVAFKRAATFKRGSYRIWQNILNVAATISPPPYADVIIAQKRLIELRGTAEGESCVDVEVMKGILSHVIASAPPSTPPTDKNGLSPAMVTQKSTKGRGLGKVFADLVMKDIKPLITHSQRLWQLVARLALHLNQPGSALDAYEKAWRTATNATGWDDGFGAAASSSGPAPNVEEVWPRVVDATIELADAYESLGERETTEGLKAGSGQLVCKNWRFKARMAVKSTIGRREKAGLGGTEALEQRLQDLKAG